MLDTKAAAWSTEYFCACLPMMFLHFALFPSCRSRWTTQTGAHRCPMATQTRLLLCPLYLGLPQATNPQKLCPVQQGLHHHRTNLRPPPASLHQMQHHSQQLGLWGPWQGWHLHSTQHARPHHRQPTPAHPLHHPSKPWPQPQPSSGWPLREGQTRRRLLRTHCDKVLCQCPHFQLHHLRRSHSVQLAKLPQLQHSFPVQVGQAVVTQWVGIVLVWSDESHVYNLLLSTCPSL